MSFSRVFAVALLLTAGMAQAEGPAALILGDATAGAGKAAACGACHGIDGNAVDPTYPKLAGQNEAYIVRQLQQFKSGERANAIMLPFASMLSEQDMHDVGAYFASQEVSPGQTDESFVKAAQKLYRAGDSARDIPACMACHGPSGRGIAGAAYPQLAGQWEQYVSAKLTEWRDGTSWGKDEHAQIMPVIAKRLTDADIAALASFAQGLHTVKAAD